jgi:hypothetical protein
VFIPDRANVRIDGEPVPVPMRGVDLGSDAFACLDSAMQWAGGKAEQRSVLVNVIEDGVMTTAPDDIFCLVPGHLFSGAVPEEDSPLAIDDVNAVENAVQHRRQNAVALFEFLQYRFAVHLLATFS